MARLVAGLCVVGFCWLLPSPLPACSFCNFPLQRLSLGQELDHATLIFFGYAANPKLNLQPGALPGTGSTDFHIEKIIKSDLNLGEPKVVTLDRFVPVLDPKDPPRFLIFCDVIKGRLDPYLGRQAKSRAVVDYLERAITERAKGKMAALQYYAKFLDHADELIAEDAFLEFARSSDAEVGQVAKKLDPALFRTFLKKDWRDAGRISLFAFLLGNCGDQSDADFLRKRIHQTQEDDTVAGGVGKSALDGLLGGYIALRPKDGWKLTRDTLADRRANFNKKYAALRTVRFYMGWQPAETKLSMLAAYQLVIPDGEMADLAIEDLRRWKIWDLSSLILAQYGKSTHDVPIVKRGIIRYALCCPMPLAQRFLDGVRQKNIELVRELEESLEFEKKN